MVDFLRQVAALTGSAFSEADATTITSKLPSTDVYQGDSLEWRPSDSSSIIVHVAVAPEDEAVCVRVVTGGDARLAERLRELLEDAL